ncbi:hypothetical protein LAG73_04385 [Pseudoxanthomonas japonensis]|nr:hypothetical protein LAG73_04385 [Pseudoxanthomonas japonensis]
MKRFAVFCLIPVLAMGCATRPVALTDTQPVPAERVFAYNQPIDTPSGTLVVVRDVGHMAGGCPLAFYIDGVLTAHLRTGEATTLTVPAGSHILGAGPAGKGMCAWTDEEANRRETAHTIEPGSQSKIRLALTREGVYQVTPTAF